MTTKPWSAIFIHGVGSEPADFAKQSAQWIATAMPGLTAGYVHWAPICDALENDFWAKAKASGSAGNAIQKIAIFDAMDALYWVNSPRIREQVFALCDQAYAKVFGSPTREVVIFGHSLGTAIALEWLQSRQHVGPVKLVTMATNALLVRAGYDDFYIPSQLLTGGRWWALYDEDDGLGWGVQRWLGNVVQDVPVRLDGLASATGLAHVHYWGTRSLWEHVIPGLLSPRPIPAS